MEERGKASSLSSKSTPRPPDRRGRVAARGGPGRPRCPGVPEGSRKRLGSVSEVTFAPYTTACSIRCSSAAQRACTSASPVETCGGEGWGCGGERCAAGNDAAAGASGRFSSRPLYAIHVSCSAQCTFDSHTRRTKRSSTEVRSQSAGRRVVRCASCGSSASSSSIESPSSSSALATASMSFFFGGEVQVLDFLLL